MMILVSFLMAAVGAIGALALADKAEEDKGNGLVNTLYISYAVRQMWTTHAGLNND